MNKGVRVAIVEDEIPAARLLQGMLQRLRPEWQYEVIQGSVESAVRRFTHAPLPELLFLDIQLADGTSFHFLERSRPQCPVIFTTAYDEYAVQAFTVNSIDYLLKPFDEERLEGAITKFETLHARAGKAEASPTDVLEALRAIVGREKRYRSRFLISGVDKQWMLQVAEVAYFYSESRVTFAVLRTGEEHIVDFTLEALTEQLHPDDFFRANRKYIVHIGSIKRIEPYFNGKVLVVVQPSPREKITVSREKLGVFKQWLNY